MLNIMIVEDEPPIARSIKNMIESFGSAYSVTSTARNGKDALCQLEEAQQEIDVMFIDIQMPVMDGLTLMKEVSSQYPSIALVVLSGYKDFSYAKQALNCNAADYLLKPVSKDDLSAVLKVLDKKINTRKTNEFEQKIRGILTGTLPDLTEKAIEVAKQRDIAYVGHQLKEVYEEVLKKNKE